MVFLGTVVLRKCGSRSACFNSAVLDQSPFPTPEVLGILHVASGKFGIGFLELIYSNARVLGYIAAEMDF